MGEAIMGMNEKDTSIRMVSYEDAMAFAKDVVHADLCGDRCMCDADDREFAKASANWRAPQDGDEGYCECGDCERTTPRSNPSLKPETGEYVEVTFYLTLTEAQEWVDAGPPWWASKNVEQHLRKAKATS
jgi:hypothetical protein